MQRASTEEMPSGGGVHGVLAATDSHRDLVRTHINIRDDDEDVHICEAVFVFSPRRHRRNRLRREPRTYACRVRARARKVRRGIGRDVRIAPRKQRNNKSTVAYETYLLRFTDG